MENFKLNRSLTNEESHSIEKEIDNACIEALVILYGNKVSETIQNITGETLDEKHDRLFEQMT